MARVIPKEELASRNAQAVERAAPAFDAGALTRLLVEAVREIKLPTPQVTVAASEPQVTIQSASTPTEWRFTVKRDTDGYISEIIARAK